VDAYLVVRALAEHLRAQRQQFVTTVLGRQPTSGLSHATIVVNTCATASEAGRSCRRSLCGCRIAAVSQQPPGQNRHADDHADVGGVEDWAQPIATKSTTAPRNGPGARNTRSDRLPAAPPSTRPKAIAADVDTTCRPRHATTAIIAPTTSASWAV